MILILPYFVFAETPGKKGTLDTLNNVAKNGGYKTTSDVGISGIVGTIITALLSLIGVIFLILMVYAGFTWMTAHGDEEKVTKAKNIITASIIGLIIVLAAYAITYFVYEYLIKGGGVLNQ